MKKPIMLGAHKPLRIVSRRKIQLYASAREINQAFNIWAAKQRRTQLVYQRTEFNPG